MVCVMWDGTVLSRSSFPLLVTFWWTFSSPGAISFLQNYLYCQMLFAYTPLKWSVFILSKIVFIIPSLLSDYYNSLFRIKTQPWKFVSVLFIVGCFLNGSEEFPERLSDIGLGISLAHRPSHITQTISHHTEPLSQTISLRFKIKILVHVQYWENVARKEKVPWQSPPGM